MLRTLPLLLLSTAEPSSIYNDKVVCEQCMFYNMPNSVVQFPTHNNEPDESMMEDFFNKYHKYIVKPIQFTRYPHAEARYRLRNVLPNVVTEVISEYNKFATNELMLDQPRYYTGTLTLTIHHNGTVESEVRDMHDSPV